MSGEYSISPSVIKTQENIKIKFLNNTYDSMYSQNIKIPLYIGENEIYTDERKITSFLQKKLLHPAKQKTTKSKKKQNQDSC